MCVFRCGARVCIVHFDIPPPEGRGGNEFIAGSVVWRDWFGPVDENKLWLPLDRTRVLRFTLRVQLAAQLAAELAALLAALLAAQLLRSTRVQLCSLLRSIFLYRFTSIPV